MTRQDSPRFFNALNALVELFSDQLSKAKQSIYWDIISPRLTIEEWEYACMQAMTRETFHKVPMPAALISYAMEHREAVAKEQEAERRQQLDAERRKAHVARLALEASPEWQAEQAAKRAEEEEGRARYHAWVASLPRSTKIALGLINPPNPARWLPLSDDELAYEPTEDPEVAKRRLRDQFRQIMDAENNPEETA